MARTCHIDDGFDTAAKSREQQSLQPAPRLRHFCAGITFEGWVGFAMEEIWKSVVGYEGFYEVSNMGRVRTSFDNPHFNARPGKLLKQAECANGYLHTHLNKRGKKHPTVHSLVLEAFTGPRPHGLVSRHKDGNARNNRSDNLEWGTQKQNIADKIAHGTDNKGSKHSQSKLTDSDVIKIRAMALDGIQNVKIAAIFKITPTNVGHIVKRKSWTHI